ncbi:hypothetical protein CTI12_AA104900 [Artemisia annua]|uniref:Reverse transcriptase zinc-binding domain-containing protein n=1 Tax=Artemisia annua TaxID=35608 RepID=A0A2U1PWB4_ARTAN|nr:hypothetical protein CTI12_AA104900 [Artemisia annua]
MVRAKELFAWTPQFHEFKQPEYVSDDDSPCVVKSKFEDQHVSDDEAVGESNEEGVAETVFDDKPLSPNNSICNNDAKEDEQHSEDPFGVYDLLNHPPKPCVVDEDPSLSHPPGFTPKNSQQDNNQSSIPVKECTSNVHAKWNDMLGILRMVILAPSSDRWTCDVNGDGKFRVKEIRSILDDKFLPSSNVATRWVKFIPIKVNIFAWRARLDRLPTRCNLQNRGVRLDSILCPLCGSESEDIVHVLFQCELASSIFRRLCRWWDVPWADIASFDEWDSWFSSIRFSSKVKLLLEGVVYAAWWHIWLFRNRSIFDASPPRRSVIFDDIVSRTFHVVW